MANWFVCVLGVGTVFCGLICIIVLCYIISFICKALGLDANGKEQNSSLSAAPVNTQNSSAADPIANKQEIIAATCAVIAEENGTDVKNIRVVSFKRA